MRPQQLSPAVQITLDNNRQVINVAIVIAILSKGVAEKLLPQARKAIIYGLLGVVIGYGVFAYDVYKVMNDPATRQQLNVMSEQMNGISFDDMLREMGIDPGTP